MNDFISFQKFSESSFQFNSKLYCIDYIQMFRFGLQMDQTRYRPYLSRLPFLLFDVFFGNPYPFIQLQIRWGQISDPLTSLHNVDEQFTFFYYPLIIKLLQSDFCLIYSFLYVYHVLLANMADFKQWVIFFFKVFLSSQSIAKFSKRLPIFHLLTRDFDRQMSQFEFALNSSLFCCSTDLYLNLYA